MRPPLDRFMPNALAWRLGEIVLAAAAPGADKCGDLIDRGLLLRRLLEERGFELRTIPEGNPQ